MIDINLLPEQLRKKRRKEAIVSGVFNIPREVIVGVGGGLIVLLLLVDVFFFIIKLGKFFQERQLQQQWEAILPQKDVTESLKKQMSEIQKEDKSLKVILDTADAAWSKRLNVISDSVPKGIWLRKIALNEKILSIEGTTVSKVKSEMISVGGFVSNLKNDKEFMKNFETIEVDFIQRRKNEALEVADFTILAKIK